MQLGFSVALCEGLIIKSTFSTGSRLWLPHIVLSLTGYLFSVIDTYWYVTQNEEEKPLIPFFAVLALKRA